MNLLCHAEARSICTDKATQKEKREEKDALLPQPDTKESAIKGICFVMLRIHQKKKLEIKG